MVKYGSIILVMLLILSNSSNILYSSSENSISILENNRYGYSEYCSTIGASYDIVYVIDESVYYIYLYSYPNRFTGVSFYSSFKDKLISVHRDISCNALSSLKNGYRYSSLIDFNTTRDQLRNEYVKKAKIMNIYTSITLYEKPKYRRVVVLNYILVQAYIPVMLGYRMFFVKTFVPITYLDIKYELVKPGKVAYGIMKSYYFSNHVEVRIDEFNSKHIPKYSTYPDNSNPALIIVYSPYSGVGWDSSDYDTVLKKFVDKGARVAIGMFDQDSLFKKNINFLDALERFYKSLEDLMDPRLKVAHILVEEFLRITKMLVELQYLAQYYDEASWFTVFLYNALLRDKMTVKQALNNAVNPDYYQVNISRGLKLIIISDNDFVIYGDTNFKI